MLIILPDMSINNIAQRVKESIFFIKNTTKQYISEVLALHISIQDMTYSNIEVKLH
jgi:hypothetical protein